MGTRQYAVLTVRKEAKTSSSEQAPGPDGSDAEHDKQQIPQQREAGLLPMVILEQRPLHCC